MKSVFVTISFLCLFGLVGLVVYSYWISAMPLGAKIGLTLAISFVVSSIIASFV